MDFYYVNNRNERIDLSDYPYMFQSGDLLNWKDSYTTRSLAKRDITSDYKLAVKEIPVQIAVLCDFSIPMADRKEGWKEAVDHLADVLQADVIDGKDGRIYTDTGYYMNCKIIGSEKSNWKMGLPFMFNTITVLADRPVWIREVPYYFKSAEITSTNNKRYPGQHAYRYANGLNNTSITNEHYAECNFLLRIYGPCLKPSVYIGGHEYHVDITLEDGEYLEIDSAEETVIKYMSSGIRVNAFHNRSFQNSVFLPIQTGKQDVFWDGKFDFDLILYEERSEPRWS